MDHRKRALFYRLTVARGWFAILERHIIGITDDRSLQLLLIAFCFGAFFEGVAGFGTPVAITAAMLIGLRFSPLAAAGLSLIANTAPVAFGAMGAPVQGLASATGLDPFLLGAMIGRQVPLFSIIIPFWLVAAFAGWRGLREVWPATLVTGLSFAIPQFVVSNFVNPWIVDIVASVTAMVCLSQFLRIWKPATVWKDATLPNETNGGSRYLETNGGPDAPIKSEAILAWVPWAILCVVLTIWATIGLNRRSTRCFRRALLWKD